MLKYSVVTFYYYSVFYGEYIYQSKRTVMILKLGIFSVMMYRYIQNRSGLSVITLQVIMKHIDKVNLRKSRPLIQRYPF